MTSQPAPLSPDMFDPGCPSSVSPFRIADKWGGLVKGSAMCDQCRSQSAAELATA